MLAIVIIVIAFLFFNTNAKADYEPQIHVAVSQEEAESYEAVLVMITSDPLPYGDNTTIASNHTVHLEFSDLGSGEVYHSEDHVLKHGLATWTFWVKPEWGEFTGILKVRDELLDSEATAKVEIVWSTQYVLDQVLAYIALELEEVEKSNDAALAQRATLDGLELGMIMGLIPLVLLRMQHNKARREGEDSYWDKFAKRFLYYSETTSRFTMYMTDPNYHHSRKARPGFLADSLLDRYHQAEDDEGLIAYEKAQIHSKIRETAPELLPQIEGGMTVEELRSEMNSQTNSQEKET